MDIQVGSIVEDVDGYEARVAKIEGTTATLDYSEFPADVPPEDFEWELDDLTLIED